MTINPANLHRITNPNGIDPDLGVYQDFILVRGTGYFDGEAAKEFRVREKSRLDDLCGPEIHKIMGRTGWRYAHGPHAVVTARDRYAKVQAMGWAVQSELGLNLSYAVAKRAEGQGFGRLVTSMAIVEADRLYGGYTKQDQIVHAQWRETNYASGALAQRLGAQIDPKLFFKAHLAAGEVAYLGASMPVVSAVAMARRYLESRGNPQLRPIYSYGRMAHSGLTAYEVSTKGDTRFSALNAHLCDGRTIEEAYQLDIKGFRAYGDDWRLGKGEPALNPAVGLWVEYKALWLTWANENPRLLAELADKANGKCLTDAFATSTVTQARALAEILNARHEPVPFNDLCDAEPISENEDESAFSLA